MPYHPAMPSRVTGRPPSYSAVQMTEIVLPSHANALGTAFGGTVMAWIDIAAAVAAQRHSGGTVVTASIDSLQFVNPVRQGDVVELRASINRAWRSSMEVGVRVACETPGDPQNARHAASAYLTFVALDEAGRPRTVPPLRPQTSEERRRFRAAAGRRAQRLDRR